MFSVSCKLEPRVMCMAGAGLKARWRSIEMKGQGMQTEGGGRSPSSEHCVPQVSDAQNFGSIAAVSVLELSHKA